MLADWVTETTSHTRQKQERKTATASACFSSRAWFYFRNSSKAMPNFGRPLFVLCAGIAPLNDGCCADRMTTESPMWTSRLAPRTVRKENSNEKRHPAARTFIPTVCTRFLRTQGERRNGFPNATTIATHHQVVVHIELGDKAVVLDEPRRYFEGPPFDCGGNQRSRHVLSGGTRCRRAQQPSSQLPLFLHHGRRYQLFVSVFLSESGCRKGWRRAGTRGRGGGGSMKETRRLA